MASPSSSIGSSGLNMLMTLDQVYIRQKTTFFKGNKYEVIGPDGTQLFYAKEESGLGAMFGGKDRAFNIDLLDSVNGQQTSVISLRRPFTFGPDKMDVRVHGRLVSVVRQEITWLKKVLNLNDAADRPLFRIKGPVSVTGTCEFEVFTRDKVCIGVIKKQWGGFGRELLTDSDSFRIRFPKDLAVEFKAALIGTCLLIDFLYYEN